MAYLTITVCSQLYLTHCSLYYCSQISGLLTHVSVLRSVVAIIGGGGAQRNWTGQTQLSLGTTRPGQPVLEYSAVIGCTHVMRVQCSDGLVMSKVLARLGYTIVCVRSIQAGLFKSPAFRVLLALNYEIHIQSWALATQQPVGCVSQLPLYNQSPPPMNPLCGFQRLLGNERAHAQCNSWCTKSSRLERSRSAHGYSW